MGIIQGTKEPTYLLLVGNGEREGASSPAPARKFDFPRHQTSFASSSLSLALLTTLQSTNRVGFSTILLLLSVMRQLGVRSPSFFLLHAAIFDMSGDSLWSLRLSLGVPVGFQFLSGRILPFLCCLLVPCTEFYADVCLVFL